MFGLCFLFFFFVCVGGGNLGLWLYVANVLCFLFFFPRCSTGGVTLFSHGGRIMLENTFESRLEIAYQQNLPILRTVIFGETAM
mmetsp:Transcript_13643/g.34749  ORF Transcript_13643/g.34749 Transcript_13643/m.34749 type:complete len:84 (-) Transcript_13643:1770-2021(-)